MLEVTHKNGSNVITFKCPNCGIEDTGYMRMPARCYYCSEQYTFDIESMIYSDIDRTDYHFGRDY
jgi:hypothetical protein